MTNNNIRLCFLSIYFIKSSKGHRLDFALLVLHKSLNSAAVLGSISEFLLFNIIYLTHLIFHPTVSHTLIDDVTGE